MATEFLLKIGEEIKKARKARKMSQKELADLVNCSPQLISKIEKGQVDTTIMNLVSIQKCLGQKKGLSVQDFYDELEQWARETGKSENTQWLKNQIESFFPMFVQWKKRREEGGIKEDDEPRSRVA